MTTTLRTAACCCDRFPGHPCRRPITQEDLRCDVCGGRDPDGHVCVAMGAIGRLDSYHVAVRFERDYRGIQVGPAR
jgi:hypothetical protein